MVSVVTEKKKISNKDILYFLNTTVNILMKEKKVLRSKNNFCISYMNIVDNITRSA